MKEIENGFYFRPGYLVKELWRMFGRRRHLIPYVVRNLF
jgi:hypothetical protein